MDDSSSPKTDLNINPDMISAGANIPTVLPTSQTNPLPTGVIDITPGSPSTPLPEPKSQHIDLAPLPDHKVVDITPDGPAPDSDITSDKGILSSHLTDLIPQTPTPDVPQTSDQVSDILHEVTPATTSPLPTQTDTTPITEEKQESPLPESVAASVTSVTPETNNQTEESTPLSPLYEDPDQVKLIK